MGIVDGNGDDGEKERERGWIRVDEFKLGSKLGRQARGQRVAR